MFYSKILISVTEICTVGCRHCGFTGSIRERQPAPGEIADWVTQACDFGIGTIIFTGGEPFQRISLLKAGVKAAASHPAKPDIACFTSSFWGKDPRTVDKFLDQLPGLTHLYLSTDVYHQEQVPTQYVRNVIDGALARDITGLSLCITIGKDEEEPQIRSLYADYGDRLLVKVDRVISSPHIDPVATTRHLPDPQNFAPHCFLHTPIVNPNGDLCACHAAKVGAHHPLERDVYVLGSLKEKSFKEIMDEADGNYSYQFLRAYGPQGVARLVNEDAALRERFGPQLFSNGCDLCSRVLLTRRGRQALAEHAADDFNQMLIDAIRATRFGEVREAAL